MRETNKGFILLWAILVLFIFMLFFSILAKIVLSSLEIGEGYRKNARAFWLAQAGINQGLFEMDKNPSWYTDTIIPKGDEELIFSTQGAFFSIKPKEQIKISRFKGQNQLYSIGFIGDNIKNSKGLVVLKVKFSFTPLKIVSWEQI